MDETLYRRAFDLSVDGIDPRLIVEQLQPATPQDMEEIKDGTYHGAIHGFCADLEMEIRTLPVEKWPLLMSRIASYLAILKSTGWPPG